MLQGGACIEAFFGEIDLGSGRVVKGKALLVPQLTVRTSLKQSIGRSDKGLYRCATFQGKFGCSELVCVFRV